MDSRIFTLGKGKFFLMMMSRYARGWWFVAGALIVAGVIASILIDIRWLIVALMILFIIVPGIAAFLYFSKGLKRECFINVIPHSISFEKTGLVIDTYKYEVEVMSDESGQRKEEAEVMNDELSEDKGKHAVEATSDEVADIREERRLEHSGQIIASYKDMGRYSVGLDSVVIPWKDGFIWIPSDAFPADEGNGENSPLYKGLELMSKMKANRD